MLPAWLLPLFVSIYGLVFGLDEAELLFAGDAMQHVAQRDAARTPSGDYDFSQCFRGIASMATSADLAVVNLETPVGCPPYAGYPCFSAPAVYARELRDAGFDLFLDSLGVRHVGTYSDAAAREAALPLTVTVNGIRIAFLNYTYGTNGISPRDGVVVDYIDHELMAADVARARESGPDLIAVCIHWGDEYHLLPNRAQKATADFLESLGVDLIIGGHPHVIQPMEFRPNAYFPDKNIFLVYSLGNFISNMKKPDTRGGAVARVRMQRDFAGKVRLLDADYGLVFTEPGTSPADNFRVVPLEETTDSRAAQFARNARQIFDNHNIGVPEAAALAPSEISR